MAVMMGNLYSALKQAGADEESARKAAEEIAGYENRFAKLESDVALLKWMVGFVIGLCLLIVGLVLRLGGPV
ncbi:MAG: integrase [Pseudomonadota bacterium]|nr:integrase [Pseudomonadota bacterium]